MTNLSSEQKLESVRQKCIEVNPRISERGHTHDPIGFPCEDDIRLADVLLACEAVKPEYLCIDSRGVLYHDYLFEPPQAVPNPQKRQRRSRVHGVWNLRQDDLELQSPETISFLHSLLCSK